MQLQPNSTDAEVFISHAIQDRKRVLEIAGELESAGVRVWMDGHQTDGVNDSSPEISRRIEGCKLVMLMCSEAALRSTSVKQQLQLAWKHRRPYLPILIEPPERPEHLAYRLEGWQWVAGHSSRPEQWLPATLQALRSAGVRCGNRHHRRVQAQSVVRPTLPDPGLQGLRSIAKLTDQLWVLPAGNAWPGAPRAAAPEPDAFQDDRPRSYRLGDRILLAVDSEAECHLLLVNEGMEGITLCACPSRLVPESRLPAGLTLLPRAGARHDAFVIGGRPGRDHLLAILSDEPLELDWMPADPEDYARALSRKDIDTLLAWLRELEPRRWTALATHFDVIA
jgi:hypothetical protein